MNPAARKAFQDGLVIPACPLALNARRKLDERRQRALFRYYIAAGAGGLAVGVHTTQFAIRGPKVGLFKPVLELAAAELRSSRPKEAHAAMGSSAVLSNSAAGGTPVTSAATIGIAGICGNTKQAMAEAALVR